MAQIDADEVIKRTFFGLLFGVSVWVGNSISELNKNVAVVIKEVSDHAVEIRDLDQRTRQLEMREK